MSMVEKRFAMRSKYHPVYVCIIIVGGLSTACSSSKSNLLDGRRFSSATKEDLLDPAAFEAMIIREREIVGKGHENPKKLVDMLSVRLDNYGRVTPRTVIEVIRAVRLYEIEREEQGEAKAIQRTFPETEQVISNLMPLVADDPRIMSEVLGENAITLDLEGKKDKAGAEYGNALDVLQPLKSEIDERRLEYLVALGSIEEQQGRRDKAIECFRLVLNYDWYNIAEPRIQTQMRELYIRAGRATIELLRRNPDALEKLKFAPSTLEELGPPLSEAIAENRKRTDH